MTVHPLTSLMRALPWSFSSFSLIFCSFREQYLQASFAESVSVVGNSKADFFLFHLPAAEQVNKINIKPSIVMKTRNIFIHGGMVKKLPMKIKTELGKVGYSKIS